MRAPNHRTCLLVLSLGLLFPLLGRAETPAEVQQRLDQYRQLDAEAARKKAAQKAEAERMREQTREWQEKRRREEYARRWKRYGDEEIDVLKWRQQKDGTWVTEFKELAPATKSSSTKGSVLSGFGAHLPPVADRLWVKVRSSISIEQLASALAQDESRLARLNDVDEDYQFQRGDWLVLPSQTSRTAKQLASVDTSELRRTPPLEALREPRRSRFILGLKPPPSSGLSWPDQAGFGSGGTDPSHSVNQLIGVNCTSLMINRKPAYVSWGSWIRPDQGSADEQLVIDRCSAPTRMAQP